ncbi:MAG: agmatinase [Bradyrhizobiaceae bacterium]|nr:agmatinase [Bradyrhizobiaceae bacterium]
MTTLGIKRNFLGIDNDFSSLERSRIAVVSAPYEHTVSYGGGTKLGPRAILDASRYVEFYDDETRRELCFDVGIATIKPIEFGENVDRKALTLIERRVAALLDRGKFIATLGGEHTISSACIHAHLGRYPDLSVLQFDAHGDLRDEYEGSPFSHASVMARVCEFMRPERLTQVGIRAICKEEATFIREQSVNTFTMSAIRKGLHGSEWVKSVVSTLQEQVYVSFDVDGLDPSIMPSTGTPEPDGLFYHEALAILREVIASGRQIVGFDVVELAPVKGVHHPDLTAARLVYKIMNLAFSAR